MKKLKKDVIKEFNIPIYDCKVKYIITYDFLAAGRKIKEELRLDINDNRGLAFKTDSAFVIMVKPRYRKSWDTIAHEALHVTNFILDDRGVKGSYKNDEAQAYLLSYIVRKIQKLK